MLRERRQDAQRSVDSAKARELTLRAHLDALSEPASSALIERVQRLYAEAVEDAFHGTPKSGEQLLECRGRVRALRDVLAIRADVERELLGVMKAAETGEAELRRLNK